MEKFLSPFQTTFVPNWWIRENIIVAHKILHTMNKKKGKKGKGAFLGIEIDIKKTYDNIKWNFILQVRSRLGFST